MSNVFQRLEENCLLTCLYYKTEHGPNHFRYFLVIHVKEIVSSNQVKLILFLFQAMAKELRESVQCKVCSLREALAQLCAAHVARSKNVRALSRRVQNLLVKKHLINI